MLHEDQLFPYVGLKELSFTDGVGVRGWRKVGVHYLKLSAKREVIMSFENQKL